MGFSIFILLTEYIIKQFNIPHYYRSSFIGHIKEIRRQQDPRRQDLSPSFLDFGSFHVYLSRHFGFCYGVENAIERTYQILKKYPDKRIYLLSEVIHNSMVNNDLQNLGVQFIFNTDGSQRIPWSAIHSSDIVIIPAFGTSVETKKKLHALGVFTKEYDTTCPFVEKVWNRAHRIGKNQYTIIIHGSPSHEETKATLSHSMQESAVVVIKNMDEARLLAKYIKGEGTQDEFEIEFKNQYSPGFSVHHHLQRIGVINQTTMLANETQSINDYFKKLMIDLYGEDTLAAHLANTQDTLCYATNENQEGTRALLHKPAHMAIVVGGYKSSNTLHLAEICENSLPVFLIQSEKEMVSHDCVYHFDVQKKERVKSTNFLPKERPLRILLTSGSSCPDTLIDRVLTRIASLVEGSRSFDEVISDVSTHSYPSL